MIRESSSESVLPSNAIANANPYAIPLPASRRGSAVPSRLLFDLISSRSSLLTFDSRPLPKRSFFYVECSEAECDPGER
jgi:hypothetical protein